MGLLTGALCTVNDNEMGHSFRERLRVAPKRIERLEYASNARQRKRGAFRVNYADMDDDYGDYE